MPDAFFDIIIAGTDISGLAAGALCARKGYTVLVLGQEERPGSYLLDGATLYRSIPLFHGFSTSSCVRALFRDVGLMAEMRNKPTPLDPNFQVVTPDVRFDVGPKREHTLREIKRAFPDSAQNIEAFFKSVDEDAETLDTFLESLPMLPAQGFWGRRKLTRYVRKSDILEAVTAPLSLPSELRFSGPLSALALFQSKIQPRPFPPLVLRRLLRHVLDGGFFEFPHGEDGLKRLFTDRIVANGGAFWPERAVEQIIIKGRKVREVLIHRPRRSAGVRMLIGNTSPRAFLNLVPPESENSDFHGFIKSIEPVCYNYTVNFVVEPDLLPEAMGSNLVLSMHPRQETFGPNVLWVYTKRPGEYDTDAPATITATIRLPRAQLPLKGGDFKALNERVLYTLEWLLPFIREKLIRVHTPYAIVDRDTGEERLNPREVREVFDTALDNTLDLTAMPCRTPYKNVLLLGDHAMGGLGLEGSFLAARRAFAQIQEKVVLKQILRG